MDLIHIENARSEEQRAVMQEISKDGVCPFCQENLARYHKKPILADGVYWVVTENQWPYEGAKIQLLAIARRHIVSFKDMTNEEAAELFKLFSQVAEEKKIKGGTIAMRFGASEEGYASSVRHLHAHLIEPNLSDSSHKGVKFTVSKPVSQ